MQDNNATDQPFALKYYYCYYYYYYINTRYSYIPFGGQKKLCVCIIAFSNNLDVHMEVVPYLCVLLVWVGGNVYSECDKKYFLILGKLNCRSNKYVPIITER